VVVVFLILINGYLLLDFFLAEVKGFLFGSAVTVALAVYLAFVVYLVLRESSAYTNFRFPMSKT
jgi:natural resistance-associated macrophage protein 2